MQGLILDKCTLLQVPWERFRVVQLRAPVLVEGVAVTFLDANHCPGGRPLLSEKEEESACQDQSGAALIKDSPSATVLSRCCSDMHSKQRCGLQVPQ